MNTKLKCLLLDDELPGLTYLKMLCEELPELEVVKAFNRPDIFLAEISRLDFDLCILDIKMPGMDGLQIADLLSGKPIIFTTAYKEYAAEAFDLDAVDYVRKPIRKERLQQAVLKAKKRLSGERSGKQFTSLNTDKGRTLIFFDQLCHIKTSEVDSRDKVARLFEGTMLTLKNISFEKLKQLLPSGKFVRVNKKEIIAIKAIQAFSSDEITTNIPLPSGNMLKLTLSEVYKGDLLERMRN